MRAFNFLACKIGQNDIFVLFVLVIIDQYPSIGPKILVHFQNFKILIRKILVHIRIRKKIGQGVKIAALTKSPRSVKD